MDGYKFSPLACSLVLRPPRTRERERDRHEEIERRKKKWRVGRVCELHPQLHPLVNRQWKAVNAVATAKLPGSNDQSCNWRAKTGQPPKAKARSPDPYLTKAKAKAQPIRNVCFVSFNWTSAMAN